MKELTYNKISFELDVDDNLDSEPVEFEISSDEGFKISRNITNACMTNPDEYPEIPGFSVEFTMGDAIRLRDFLNFAFPKELV